MPAGRTWVGRGRAKKKYFRRRGKPLTRSQVRVVRKIVEQQNETKFVDTTIDETGAYVANSAILWIVPVAEGDGESDREGQAIKIRSVQVHCLIRDIGAANADGDVLYRVAMVLKKEVDGATLAYTEVWETDDPRSFRDWETRKDYKIMKEWTGILKKADTVGHRSARYIKFYHKFKKPIKCTFKGDGTAVIGNAQENHLFLVFSSSAANTDQPGFTGNCRVTYTD